MISTLMNVQWGLLGLDDLINIHPVFVHFPVALLMSSFLFYLFGTFSKKEELIAAGKWALLLGTAAAAAAVWSGQQAEATVEHGSGVHAIMEWHETLGFVILGLSAFLSGWILLSRQNLPAKGKALFLAILFVLSLLIVQSADLGGRMVYLNGVGVGRKSMLAEELQEAGAHDHDAHDHEAHEHTH